MKKKYKMSIFDPEREKQIISEATKTLPDNEKKYTESFLHNLMDISKEVQSEWENLDF